MKSLYLFCLALVALSILSMGGAAGADEPVVTAPEDGVVVVAPPVDPAESELFPAEGCPSQDPTEEQLFAAIPDPGCALNPGVNCNLTYKGYCDTFCGLNCSICQANGCCICTVCQWP